MKGKDFVVICLAFMVILLACQEDEEVLFDEPSVKMRFFNMNQLKTVNDTLKKVNDSIKLIDSVLTYHSDSANVLQDSVFVLERLIEEGQIELQSIFDDLSIELAYHQGEYAEVSNYDSIMNASKNQWNKVATTINSGSVALSSIKNKKRNDLPPLLYDPNDSATAWNLPLSMSEDDVFLAITIGSKSYDLEVSYRRSTTVDDKGNVVVEASELQAFTDRLKNGFDSLEMKCITPECIDSETTINIYF